MGLPVTAQIITLDVAVVDYPNQQKLTAGFGIGVDTTTPNQAKLYIQNPVPIHVTANYSMVGDEDIVIADTAGIDITLEGLGSNGDGRPHLIINASGGSINVKPFSGQRVNSTIDLVTVLTTGQWMDIRGDSTSATWRGRAW